MPLRPTSTKHYTGFGRNPHYLSNWRTSLSSIVNFCLRRENSTKLAGAYTEPESVELVFHERDNSLFSAPVIDFTRNLVAIPHTDRVQLYKVAVNREPGSLSAICILDPLEVMTPGCCGCNKQYLLNTLDEFLIHYRESSWTLESGDKIYALGYRRKDRKYVALQVAPYVPCDVPYDLFVGIDLRNGSRYSVTSVEHNMALYKAKDAIHDAPFVAKSILAHIRITDFPADGTSALEGGDAEATVVKLEDKPVNDDLPMPPIKVVPALATTETGVIAKTKQAVVEAEVERVEPYLNDTKPPEWIEKAKKEFMLHLFPRDKKNTGVPMSLEEARDLDRPSQARSFANVENDVINNLAKSIKIFLKTESMDPASAPRIISNPDDHLRVFSRMFGEPLAAYIKSRISDHYGFVAPAKLEMLFERTVGLAKENLTETDFSKMDATINMWFRRFELELGLEFFSKEFHPMWRTWHAKLYAEPKSKKLMGHSIYMGASRRSGEYFTSLFNTVENLFYCTCVVMYVRKCSVVQALQHVGCVGGDDGLHPDLDPTAAKEVGALLGFIVKATTIPLGQPVSFLGLVRFDHGVYSYDPIRFVRKCSSIATGDNIPAAEAAFRKFEAFAKMYPNVPIVGTMSNAVLRILRGLGKTGVERKYDKAARNINGFITTMMLEQSGLMPCDASYDQLMGYVADRLHIEVAKLEKIEQAFKSSKTFSDFPSHVINVDGVRKNFTYPTMFQGNIYCGSSPPARGSDNVKHYPNKTTNAKPNAKPKKKTSRDQKTSPPSTNSGSATQTGSDASSATESTTS